MLLSCWNRISVCTNKQPCFFISLRDIETSLNVHCTLLQCTRVQERTWVWVLAGSRKIWFLLLETKTTFISLNLEHQQIGIVWKKGRSSERVWGFIILHYLYILVWYCIVLYSKLLLILLLVMHDSQLHWYYRSDPEWLAWYWWVKTVLSWGYSTTSRTLPIIGASDESDKSIKSACLAYLNSD